MSFPLNPLKCRVERKLQWRGHQQGAKALEIERCRCTAHFIRGTPFDPATSSRVTSTVNAILKQPQCSILPPHISRDATPGISIPSDFLVNATLSHHKCSILPPHLKFPFRPSPEAGRKGNANTKSMKRSRVRCAVASTSMTGARNQTLPTR